MIEYIILQFVKSVSRGWYEKVYTGKIERIAQSEFHRLVKEYPDEYFELIKIEHNETCLEFTQINKDN